MGKKWLIIGVLLVVSAVIMVLYHYDRGLEGELQLTLRFSQNQVTALVNGHEVLTQTLESSGVKGRRFGLYMFKSFEALDHTTYFRNLHVRSNGNRSYHWPLLTQDDLTDAFAGFEGWEITPGKGLTLCGEPGSRGVCLIKDLAPQQFVLDVDILTPIDVGVFFAASDRKNGQILIIRPFLNDVFFTSLEAGEPGPIQSIGPLQQLTLKHEAIRLGSLLGDLILRSALFLVSLWLIGTAFVRMVRIRSGRFDEALGRFLNGRLLPLLLFGITFGILGCVARYALDAVPHIADETAYLFQAKIFAQGKLWATVPDLPEFFQFEHIIMDNGRWFSKYPPLFSMVLALGVLAGVPWLVNPLLGALSGLFIFLLVLRITGSRGCGLLAWLLLITSPFFLMLNASMMAHGLSLLLTVLFVYLLCRGLESHDSHVFILSGFSVGALILTRPFTALLISIPAVIYVIGFALLKGQIATGFKQIFAIGLGILPFLVFVFFWHHIYLSDDHGFLNFFYMVYHDSDRLGFGSDKGAGWMLTWGTWGHTPAKGLRSIYNYLSYTSQHLFGWPWRLSFAFVGIGLIFGRHKGICWALFGMFISLVAGHLFYWCSQHIGYGARYWYSGMVGLIIPTVCGVMFVRNRLAEAISNRMVGQKVASRFMGLILMGLVSWNLIGYLPERLKEGHNYANVAAGLKERVEEMDLGRALVFVKTENLLYNDGFFMNDPFMNANVIFARDLGKRNQALMAKYPEYDVYHWDKKVLMQSLREGATDTGDQNE